MIRAYRITKTRYVDSTFSGEGARLAGGRWNPIGAPVVYLASSLSLATLELLVHLDDYALLLQKFSYIEVDIPPSMLEIVEPEDLPEFWNSDGICAASQLFCGSWLNSKRSAALAVPSVVTPNERNYLLNPSHPDFAKIIIHSANAFTPDSRLSK